MADVGTVIVTGGSRGIGAAIASRLGSLGYAVAVGHTGNSERANAVVKAIVAAGGKAHAVGGDIGDPAQIEPIFTNAEASLGPLVALVNNAGIIGIKGPLDTQDAASLSRLFAINVVGTMLCTAAAARRLSTRHGGKGGVIVNIGSIAGHTGGMPGLATYAASKAAVETFTRGMANELGSDGIRVNAVSPGLIQTDMVTPEMAEATRPSIPVGRMGRPDDIAEAVAYLLSPAASYMTGSIMTVSGGR